MDLFSLVAKLTLDDSQYKQALSSAETQGEGFGSSFQDVIGKVASALTAAGITAAIKGIADQFARMINNTAQYADKVDKGSQRLGISTSAYQEWNHALSQSGASIDTVSRGIVNLNAAISGSATDKVSEALDALSIDPSKYKSTEDLLDAVFTALADMEAGAERDTLIEQIFGRGGMELAAFLNSGSAGIKELRQEAHDLGLIMSGEDIANGVAYGDAVANLQAALDAIQQHLVKGILPLLTDAVNFVTQIIAFFNGREAQGIFGVIMNIADEESEAVQQAEEDSIKAQGIVNYLDSLVKKYGEAAKNTTEWATAMGQLQEVMPGVRNLIKGEHQDLNALNTSLREYIANSREQAVADAKRAALQSYTDKYVEAVRDQGVAEINMQIANEQAAEARRRLIEIAQRGDASFTGEGMSMDQIKVAAQAYANELAYSGQDTRELNTEIETLVNTYNEQTQRAQELAGNIATLSAESLRLQREMEIAEQALANLASSANSAAGSAGSLGYTPYGAWATNYYTQRYGGSHASGLNYVPFDGYMAELHRGETVLNQAQAREWRQGDGGIDTQALNRAVAEAVASAVSCIQINMDGAAVGNAVTKQVSANIYQAQLGRRYSPAW